MADSGWIDLSKDWVAVQPVEDWEEDDFPPLPLPPIETKEDP